MLRGTDVGFGVVFAKNQVMAVVRERVLVPLLRVPAVQRLVLSAGDQLDLTYRRGQLAAPPLGPPRHRPSTTGRRWTPSGAMATLRSARAPQAGDRAPDLVLTDSATGVTTRLSDVLRGPHFTLLVFTADTRGRDQDDPVDAPARHVRQRLGPDVRVCTIGRTPRPRSDDSPVDVGLHDSTGAAQRRYGVTGGALCLVRPDGYVAFRAQGLDEEGVLSYLDGVLARRSDVLSATGPS